MKIAKKYSNILLGFLYNRRMKELNSYHYKILQEDIENDKYENKIVNLFLIKIKYLTFKDFETT